MDIRYRTGTHWGSTIIEYDAAQEPDKHGHRPSDRLVAMAQSAADAKVMVSLLNFGRRHF